MLARDVDRPHEDVHPRARPQPSVAVQIHEHFEHFRIDKQIIFQVAQALWSGFVGIFALGVFVFFGVAPLLMGVALRSNEEYPAWTGPAAIVGGAIGMVLGVILAFIPISFTTYAILFGTSSSLLAAWMTMAGVLIWRANAVAPAIEVRRVEATGAR
jgi:glucan phosphoethanolaminetransferase (alkaline phosphatase superfamily)